MVNSNADVLGILFPNSYDSLAPELVTERLMASIPFASRYRIVDFLLSSMVNCGIGNVSLLVRQNYRSLMDHLGSGREWDLARKNGGLNMVPPYAENTVKMYTGRVEALASILPFLREQKEKYVILADTNIVVNFDFNAMLKAHQESGADITVAYAKEELADFTQNETTKTRDLYYSFELDENGRVSKLLVNPNADGEQNVSMNIYVMERQFLIDMISDAYMSGHVYMERDVLAPQLDKINVQSYLYDGYFARITSLASYFKENMKMLDENNCEALFAPGPIYTKIHDNNPTRYLNGSVAKNVMVADGCVIEGEVENCVLFRGVKIGKGAKVKNCVLMQNTVIEADAQVEYAITDKNVTVTAGKQIKGEESFPVYVGKGKTV